MKDWIKDDVVGGIQWYRDSDDISDVMYRCNVNDRDYYIKRSEGLWGIEGEWELFLDDKVIKRNQYRMDLKLSILKIIKQNDK